MLLASSSAVSLSARVGQANMLGHVLRVYRCMLVHPAQSSGSQPVEAVLMCYACYTRILLHASCIQLNRQRVGISGRADLLGA